MKQVGEFKMYTSDEVLGRHFGKIGTPRRDELEQRVIVPIHAYRLDEAVKETRIEQDLTQEELDERIGMKHAQISGLEKGYSTSIPAMGRVFRALGVSTASIDLGKIGEVALW